MGIITNILVTGAIGNVGGSIVRFLQKEEVSVYAADLNEKIVNLSFGDKIQFRKLDFYERKTFETSLQDINKVFLMRPPQIGEVKKYMFPFIDLMKKNGIEHVITLSIADANPMVPHYKIEKYVEDSKIPYTHLRGGYFMQNLSKIHREVIQNEKDLFIPAGDAKFNFTDTKDIAEVAAKILLKGGYTNQTLNITGKDLFDLHEIASKMTKLLNQPFYYSNPSGKEFKKKMLQYGFHKDNIRIMRLIYFAAKRKGSDKIYPDFEEVLKKNPRTIDNFIKENAKSWIDHSS